MLKSFLEKIVEYVKAGEPVISVDDRKYFNVPGQKPAPVLEPKEPTAFFSTLTGLLGWANDQQEDKSECYFVVTKSNEVRLFSILHGAFQQRDTLAIASHVADRFSVGQFMPTEEFIIAALTRFAPNEELIDLLRILGNVKDEAVRTQTDDGISQTVVAREGIATVGNVTLPNPVYLKPYCVFPEIDPPLVPLVFRGQKGPQWALFDTSNAQWEIEAKKRTVAFIEANSNIKVFA